MGGGMSLCVVESILGKRMLAMSCEEERVVKRQKDTILRGEALLPRFGSLYHSYCRRLDNKISLFECLVYKQVNEWH